MKRSVTMRLEEDKLAYIDYIANKLDPARPNRTRAVELLIDLVDGSFTDDMVMMHSQAMDFVDRRKKN